MSETKTRFLDNQFPDNRHFRIIFKVGLVFPWNLIVKIVLCLRSWVTSKEKVIQKLKRYKMLEWVILKLD